MIPRRPLAYVLALLVMVGLTACGVGPTDRPVDEGDAAAGDSGSEIGVRTPPKPNDALTAEDQVRNFLQAAVGGLAAANDNVKTFLTATALSRWVDPVPAENPPLSVIRIVGGPTVNAPVGGRTSVELDYQVIGVMNDQGRIDDLAPIATKHMTFWVVADPEGPVLIDEIQGWPGGLVISDEGLHNYYQMQPIYFWDTEYKLLVPDLRYMPLTRAPEVRAKQVLTWLMNGPSPWLSSSVQRLPNGSGVNDVLSGADGALLVDLNAASAGTGDPDALRRLTYQIQWSLAPIAGVDTEKGIDIRLDEQEVAVTVSDIDFRRSNHSRTYTDAPTVTYDIQQGVVVAVGGAGSSVLAVGENNSVDYAAIRDDVGAFVRTTGSGRRTLQIVRVGSAAISAQVPASSAMGRPAFVPGTDFVLVPTGGSEGRLYAVSIVDGRAEEVRHSLNGVTSVSVSPDGRRVAVVADGEVHVLSLVVANNQVNLASTQRQLLADRLNARAVTWTSESWLLVAGTSGSSQALWRVSSDGVLVEDLSGQLRGISVLDLVCYPSWTGVPSWNSRGRVGALATTPSGIYLFRSQPEPEGLTNPFFAS